MSRWQPTPYVSTDDRFPLDGQDNLYSGKLTWNLGADLDLVGTVFADPTRIDGRLGRGSAAGGRAPSSPRS